MPARHLLRVTRLADATGDTAGFAVAVAALLFAAAVSLRLRVPVGAGAAG